MAPKVIAPKLLVDSRWFHEHRRDPNVVFIDTRSADDYWKGHLRSARHFDPFPFRYYNTDERGSGEFRTQLELIFSALGITGSRDRGLYENDSGMRAARNLCCCSNGSGTRSPDARWRIESNRGRETHRPPRPSAPLTSSGRSEISRRAYLIENLGRSEVQIFDVRSEEEYFSEKVRARRGGAIPGSVHRDWTASIAEDGRLKPAKQLRAEFEALGLRPDAEIVPYCQGGYRAAHAYVALKLAGYPQVRNYWGSWAEWGNREDVPIEHPVRKG